MPEIPLTGAQSSQPTGPEQPKKKTDLRREIVEEKITQIVEEEIARSSKERLSSDDANRLREELAELGKGENISGLLKLLTDMAFAEKIDASRMTESPAVLITVDPQEPKIALQELQGAVDRAEKANDKLFDDVHALPVIGDPNKPGEEDDLMDHIKYTLDYLVDFWGERLDHINTILRILGGSSSDPDQLSAIELLTNLKGLIEYLEIDTDKLPDDGTAPWNPASPDYEKWKDANFETRHKMALEYLEKFDEAPDITFYIPKEHQEEVERIMRETQEDIERLIEELKELDQAPYPPDLSQMIDALQTVVDDLEKAFQDPDPSSYYLIANRDNHFSRIDEAWMIMTEVQQETSRLLAVTNNVVNSLTEMLSSMISMLHHSTTQFARKIGG